MELIATAGCRRSGWKVRLLTRNGAQQGPTGEEIKAAWQYDAKSAIVICDPTSPNILQFQVFFLCLRPSCVL